MIDNSSIEQPKEYWEVIREKEQEMFPEFASDDKHATEENRYVHFAPSWHFKSGLITEADVDKLASDSTKTLLSIGAGPAHLERLLTTLGVKSQNMTLTDIDAKSLPSGFNTKVFDMYQPWNELGNEKYDLIIFPESTLFNVRFETDEEKQRALYRLIRSGTIHLKPGGIIRIPHKIGIENVEAVQTTIAKYTKKIKLHFNRHLVTITVEDAK